MKKKMLIVMLLLAVCIVVNGCGKKEEKETKEENNNVVGGWEVLLTDNQVGLEEEDLKALNDAKEQYVGLEIEPVALLAKQVVAGTNYMYLAKGTPVVQNPETSYKIVIVYKDLQGNSTITKVNDFDFTKYTNNDIEGNSEQLSGGWNTVSPGKINVLDGKVGEIWENVTATLTGMSYNPIAVLGKQIVSGTNYAVLCYGKGSYEGSAEGIYLVTLYEDLKGNGEITSIAYVNLAEFNK